MLGFSAGAGLGIFCKNRKEYVVAELASYCLSGYNTVREKRVKFGLSTLTKGDLRHVWPGKRAVCGESFGDYYVGLLR